MATVAGLEFEVFFEGEYGMETAIIHASSVQDMMKQLRAQFPNDIGADGFYNHPITDTECALNW